MTFLLDKKITLLNQKLLLTKVDKELTSVTGKVTKLNPQINQKKKKERKNEL